MRSEPLSSPFDPEIMSRRPIVDIACIRSYVAPTRKREEIRKPVPVCAMADALAIDVCSAADLQRKSDEIIQMDRWNAPESRDRDASRDVDESLTSTTSDGGETVLVYMGNPPAALGAACDEAAFDLAASGRPLPPDVAVLRPTPQAQVDSHGNDRGRRSA
jgi:hypothetical protein